MASSRASPAPQEMQHPVGAGLARDEAQPVKLELAEPVDQRLVLLRRPDTDPQELGNPLLLEVPHNHPLLTQLGGQPCSIMPRVTREDEVRRRRQHLKPLLSNCATTWLRLSITH